MQHRRNENKQAKTEVLHLSRNPDQCKLQVNGATLKQVEKLKYLGVTFTSDGRQDDEPDGIGVARIFDWGGGQTTNHLQCRHQKFSKEELFAGLSYRRMEDLMP